ncbi:YcgN family cysteine cluster protein [Pseudohalocynthiibacter aestuariivivens]|nr:YcgN family cysteine cluster protein [Pseudohalocynthiibacter aestuariivivens]QIE45466.1 YcgN family cysteine cluster protein [Pseudohalocynthiibacter aestuariivivens]
MTALRPRFWETVSLQRMTRAEWEALCDGCGKCCMNKLEDEDTGEVALTRVACRLFDDTTCRCAQYPIRHQFVPECIVLKPANMDANLYWMPDTCAYKLLWQGKPLFDWHPLISGDPETVHAAGVSMQSRTVPEFAIDEDDWEDHIIEEPT